MSSYVKIGDNGIDEKKTRDPFQELQDCSVKLDAGIMFAHAENLLIDYKTLEVLLHNRYRFYQCILYLLLLVSCVSLTVFCVKNDIYEMDKHLSIQSELLLTLHLMNIGLFLVGVISFRRQDYQMTIFFILLLIGNIVLSCINLKFEIAYIVSIFIDILFVLWSYRLIRVFKEMRSLRHQLIARSVIPQ